MPKMIRITLFIMLTLASLLLVVSCGSDKGGAAPRINPIDTVTGSAGINSVGSNNTGGSGGGACVITMPGYPTSCVDTTTVPSMSQTLCGYSSGVWNAGATCVQLGY